MQGFVDVVLKKRILLDFPAQGRTGAASQHEKEQSPSIIIRYAPLGVDHLSWRCKHQHVPSSIILRPAVLHGSLILLEIHGIKTQPVRRLLVVEVIAVISFNEINDTSGCLGARQLYNRCRSLMVGRSTIEPFITKLFI